MSRVPSWLVDGPCDTTSIIQLTAGIGKVFRVDGSSNHCNGNLPASNTHTHTGAHTHSALCSVCAEAVIVFVIDLEIRGEDEY